MLQSARPTRTTVSHPKILSLMPDARPLIWTDVPLHADALALLNANARLIGPAIGPGNAADRFAGFAEADAAIVSAQFSGDAATFARGFRLQVVARTGIGYDNVDIPALTTAGICAVNTPDAPTESTAEFAVGLMFAVARHIATADRNSKRGVWKTDASVLGFDLADKTLGLVGFGRIARRVAEIARAIRMRVLAFDPFVPAEIFHAAGVTPCATLPALLREAHVVSVHAPLGATTRRIIGAAELALMPAGAILINTSRGPLIDDAAVLQALDAGRLAGAGIDVWDPEPVAADHPLFVHPLVVATPHIASATREGRRRSHVAAAELVLGALRGERPATLINPETWPPHRRGGRQKD